MSSMHRLTRAASVGALAAVCVFTGSARAAEPPPKDVVQQWNQIAENTVIAAGAFQNEGLIYMAYVSEAVHDAVVAIHGNYRPLNHRIHAPDGALPEAAVVEAAYQTLRFFLPSQASTLEAAHFEAIAQLGSTLAVRDGQRVGEAAADVVIKKRRRDGRQTPVGVSSTFDRLPAGPGVWRLTPPYALPQTPWVGDVRPFVLRNVNRFRPAPPPELTSDAWVAQFDEIKLLGKDTSAARTTQQTAVARFWTANVIRQYNRAGRDLARRRALRLVDSARLFAMINVIGADAQIAVMHWKYTFLFWRPVTAIDPTSVTNDAFGDVPGFDDDNPRTIEEVGWRPLIGTPNHPEYPAAHGSITSAMATVFAAAIGSDIIDLDPHGVDPTVPTANLDAVRHFATVDDLRAEIVNARLWAGLHYRGSSEAGVALGAAVAAYDLRHAFGRRHRDDDE